MAAARKSASENNGKLFVRNIPSQFSEGDIKDFFNHFGAQYTTCFGKKGKMKNSAFLAFANQKEAEVALKRLHQLDLLGCLLRAEYANNDCEKAANIHESRKVLNKASNVGSSKNEKNNANENKDDQKDETVSGIAPKLGIHHSLPGHLAYVYPAPTVTILTNIANALASVPRFYTQVLHLMNKMSLPPPFTGPTVTPPLPGDSVALKDEAVDTSDLHLYASSEESELESDQEERPAGNLFGDMSKSSLEPQRKKRRLRAANVTAERPRKPKQQQDVENAFEPSQQVSMKRIEFKLAANIAATVLPMSSPALTMEKHTQETLVPNSGHSENTGFGIFEPSPAEEEEEEEEFHGAGEDFVSLEEIRCNRMTDADLEMLPQMKNYDRGPPSSRLYIKNLGKQVVKEDLEYLFRRFLNQYSDVEREMFDIRLMKEGRMKGQAFVTFPTDEVALKALRCLHGYVLHDRPMLIQFGRSNK
ncbi:RNA-binding region-containing protein 3-like [Rhopilema esculentum]|uniref:RNA-binding region-containing protein 3-like n=1 Tax=Rhopilema esculentum TaxID=499914 RepID=UPI0031DC3CA9